MRRRRDEESHGNSDRWLLTYADMITLLMAFFIMMYSMSVLNLSKFHEAAISIRSGFGGIARGQGKSVLGSSGSFSAQPTPIRKGELAGAAWRAVTPLVDYIEQDSKLRNTVKVVEDQRGIVVSVLTDDMLFKPGSAQISDGANPLLGKIAEMLYKTANNIRIEGHTCDLPPRDRAGFPTNWELSTARATNVLRYFVEQKGLDARQFSVAGFAGLRPMFPNTSEANRRRNRRVDIVIVTAEEPVVMQQLEAANGESKPQDLFPQRVVPWPVDPEHAAPQPIAPKPGAVFEVDIRRTKQ